ncbi:Heat shock protein 90-5, chloroplastic [Linum perenne]
MFLLWWCSNASDALDKLRFLSVTEPSLLGDSGELEIRIKTDADEGTITITYVRIENKDLGADNSLIGQFGVGFYSAFLVAQKVEEEEKPKEGEPEMRNAKEVEKEEYQEFYKKTFNEFLEPLTHTHFNTEGEVEFRSILYIPGMGPMNNEDVVNPKTKNIRLYVKRVFISDDFDGELFPRYLSFVKGVVDSDDLPLNVSREILQESRIDYKKFWENFGKLMKAQALGDTSSLEFMRGRRILEVNVDHPIVQDLNAACKNAPDSNEARRAVELLYETALISSGFTPDSPADLGTKIYEMMAMALGGRWGRSEEDDADSSTKSEDAIDAGEDGSEVVEPSEVRTESDPWQD